MEVFVQMLAWGGMFCKQYMTVVLEFRAERERIKTLPSEEAKTARDNLDRTWQECQCPKCGSTRALKIYSFYRHPVDELLSGCKGDIDFLRLKCSHCRSTHAVFPIDYIPFSSKSIVIETLHVYSASPVEPSGSNAPGKEQEPKDTCGDGGSPKPARKSPCCWPAEKTDILFGMHSSATEATEVHDKEVFFCGEKLPDVVLNRDREEASFRSVPISSLCVYKSRAVEDFGIVCAALRSLGAALSDAGCTMREAIRQMLLLPLTDFMEAFCGQLPFKTPHYPFMANKTPFLSGRFTYGIARIIPIAL